MTELKVEATELEALKKRVEELEKAAKPAEPFVPMPPFKFDPTEGMSMPRSAMMEMAKAIPESVMRGIVADARRPNPANPPTPSQPTTQVQRGSGCIDERPLEPPPGISHIDAMVKAQDAQDRAELARKIAQARLSKGEVKE